VDLGVNELATLKAKVARLESEVDELKALVTRMCSELGIHRDGTGKA
jgi:hypothetical protein